MFKNRRINRGNASADKAILNHPDSVKHGKKVRVPNLLSIILKKTLKKTGYLYKRGDGPINFNWNTRYFILEGNTLFYYMDASDKDCRGMTKLAEAIVSPVDKFEVEIDVCKMYNMV